MEEIKATFVRSVNKLAGERKTLLADLREIQKTYSGTDEIEQRLRDLDERLNAEADAVQELIAQNARVAKTRMTTVPPTMWRSAGMRLPRQNVNR